MKKYFFPLFLLGCQMVALADEYEVCSPNLAYPYPATLCGCHNFYLDVENLYWKSHEDGLAYAADFTLANGYGNVKELNWDARSGIRAGGGYVFETSRWDLSFIYTRYNGHAEGSADGLLIGIWNPNAFGYAHASGDWDLRFQTFDLNLGKSFFIGPCNTLEPFISIRAARTKETYDIQYLTDALAEASTFNRQHVSGFGPRAGFNASWNFWCHLSLVGEGACSLLWTEYSVRRLDRPDATTGNPNNLDQNFHTLRPALEYRLGVNWTQGFYSDYCFLNIFLAWEQQIWFDHNMMFYGPVGLDVFVNNRLSNLNLYGLTARAELCF